MHRLSIVPSMAMLLVAVSSLSVRAQEEPPASLPPSDLKISRGIVFKKGEAGGPDLDLLFVEPLVKKYNRAPLVIYIHGGGFTKGDKDWIFKPDIVEVIRGSSKAGIACASIEYRFVKEGGPTVLDIAADCKDAVRFFVRNAGRFDIDPNRIGVFGCSVGGVLALITALGDDDAYPCDPSLNGADAHARCAVTYYAAIPSLLDDKVKEERARQIAALKKQDLGAARQTLEDRVRLWVGGPLAEKREIAERLSPVSLVRKGSPPLLLVHGDADTASPIYGAYLMEKAARAQGVPVELIVVKGANHFLVGDPIEPSLVEINRCTTEFFVQNLLPRE